MHPNYVRIGGLNGDLPDGSLPRLDALLFRNLGDAGRDHGKQEDLLVQRLIVLDMVQKVQRRQVGSPGHEHGRAGHAVQRVSLEIGEEQLDRKSVV